MPQTPNNLLDTPTPPTGSTSSSSYFTYPVRYAVTSALRRLSSDPWVTSSSSRGRSENRSGSDRPSPNTSNLNLIDLDDSDPTFHTDPKAPLSKQNQVASTATSSFRPSPRASPSPAPFQPPPLTAVTLVGLPSGSSSSAQILSRLLAEEIRLLLPTRLQLVDSWRLVFSLERDGSSLSTLYEKCEEYKGKRGGFVLVVKDSLGGIFGAYLSDPPQPSRGHYYGNGECFLWRSAILRPMAIPSLSSLPPPPSEDTTNAVRMTTIGSPKSSTSNNDQLRPPAVNGGTASGASTPERIRFKAFPYSGINDYMIFCEHSFLSVGGGDGHYGLWIDSSLDDGVSDSCPTFGNEPLSDEGKKFEVMNLEIWFLGS